MGIFGKLFGNSPPPFDRDAAITALLSTLPPCTQHVVVASHRYSGNYRCEVTVPAEYLADFARRHAERTIGGSRESEVARVAMPIWLTRASRDDKSSYMPQPFVKNVDAYVLNFIKDGSASVHCNDCGAVVREFQEQTRNESRAGPWSEWTSSWRCPHGHLLYTEDHEVHFVYARRES